MSYNLFQLKWQAKCSLASPSGSLEAVQTLRGSLLFYDKFMEKHKLWAAVHESAPIKRHKAKTDTCSHLTQFQLMAYSDGTSGWEPNICTHDLSCFPAGLSVEKYSDTIVSACVCVGVSVELLFSFFFFLLYKLEFTPTHTSNHQKANGTTERGRWRASQVSLCCVSLCLCLSHLAHLNGVSLSSPSFSLVLVSCKCWTSIKQIF